MHRHHACQLERLKSRAKAKSCKVKMEVNNSNSLVIFRLCLNTREMWVMNYP